jgi:hypothetical protein
MKTEDVLAMLSIAGVAFMLWEWKPQQKRVYNDSQNLSQDWRAIGGDIRVAMRNYDQRNR